MACIIRSLRLPRPKPSTDSNTPESRLSSISVVSSSSLTWPTLKSPSVASITRLTPPSTNELSASLYASRMPASPAVLPPASSRSSADRIAALSDALVGSSTVPALPA